MLEQDEKILVPLPVLEGKPKSARRSPVKSVLLPRVALGTALLGIALFLCPFVLVLIGLTGTPLGVSIKNWNPSRTAIGTMVIVFLASGPIGLVAAILGFLGRRSRAGKIALCCGVVCFVGIALLIVYLMLKT